MKNFARFSLMMGLFLSLGFQARAYTSLYVFGDCISTTTNNTSGMPCYYGQRYSNGRVWVEDLAQMQGLTYDPKKNDSYFANYSWLLVTNINKFNAADLGSSLVVLWINNADLWYAASYDGNNQSQWNASINQSQNNHFNIIANLYAKGVRTLVMPNAVDVSKIPYFNADHYTNFISAMCANYNVAFTATLNRARASFPGLKIYTPDFNSFFMSLLANPSYYGVTNALYNGRSIDATDDPSLKYPTELNGPGADYIFWDYVDPTAKVHYWMATIAQQLISPVKISGVTPLNSADRVDMVNVPIGQNGLVLGSTNLSSWTTNFTFDSTSATQSVVVPVSTANQTNLVASIKSSQFSSMDDSGPPPPPGGGTGGTNAVIVTSQFYKLSFPVNWTWP